MITKFQWADGSLHDEAPSFREIAICDGCHRIIENKEDNVAFITYRNDPYRRMLMIHGEANCAFNAMFNANKENENAMSD